MYFILIDIFKSNIFVSQSPLFFERSSLWLFKGLSQFNEVKFSKFALDITQFALNEKSYKLFIFNAFYRDLIFPFCSRYGNLNIHWEWLRHPIRQGLGLQCLVVRTDHVTVYGQFYWEYKAIQAVAKRETFSFDVSPFFCFDHSWGRNYQIYKLWGNHAHLWRRNNQ